MESTLKITPGKYFLALNLFIWQDAKFWPFSFQNHISRQWSIAYTRILHNSMLNKALPIKTMILSSLEKFLKVLLSK